MNFRKIKKFINNKIFLIVIQFIKCFYRTKSLLKIFFKNIFLYYHRSWLTLPQRGKRERARGSLPPKSVHHVWWQHSKDIFSSNAKNHKLNSIDLTEARSKMLSSLNFLKNGFSREKPFPWLNRDDQDDDDLFRLLRIHRDYIRSTWLSYPSHIALFDCNDAKLDRWDLLMFYPDYPLPYLFDLNRFIESFPEESRTDYYIYAKQKRSNLSLEGRQNPGLWTIIQEAMELQTEWAGRLFIQPLTPGSSGNSFYNSLYDFSGKLIYGLMVISEMIYSIEYGLSFHPQYSIKLTEYINTFFKKISQSNATVADFLFLHSAIQRFWSIINGLSNDIPINSRKEDMVFFSSISGYQKKSPIIDQVRTFFLKNPISPLLMIDFLSDMRLLNPEEKERFFSISCLFKAKIDEEVIFWMANHAYSGLMSPYMKSGLTCFGTVIPSDPEELFRHRVNCLGQLLNSTLGEIGEHPKARNKFLQFCAYFYNMLLRDWLLETSIENFPAHPLPKADKPGIPKQVLLSHFEISQSQGKSKCEEIVKALKEGREFTELARRYSEDSMSRHSEGKRGWVKIGDLPPDQEPAVFLFPEDQRPFLLTTGEAYHFFLIHEREFYPATLLLERIVQWAQGKEGDPLRLACLALFEPLNVLIENLDRYDLLGDMDKTKIESVKRLYQKAQPYHKMLSFSQESITLM